jgi:hypothetical protein
MLINPLIFWGGLTAVSIPIIIHLLNRRKFERVVWAAMRFLKVSVEQNQRRIQVEDILLLILRCLLIALLVLTLARPLVPQNGGMWVIPGMLALIGFVAVLIGIGVARKVVSYAGYALLALGAVWFGAAMAMGKPLGSVASGTDAETTAIVVLDNSYSMSQTDGVEPRIVSAKKAAEEVIRSLPTGSSVAVILGSDIADFRIQQFSHDLTYAISNIKEAPLYDRPTNLYPAIKAAYDRLSTAVNPRKELFVITDGQSSAFRQMSDIQDLFEKERNHVRPHLLFVGKNEDKNMGITALRVEGGMTPINTPVRVEVRVKNWGKAEHRDLKVSIAVDSDPPMDQAVIESIPAGEEKGVAMFARFKAEGYHTITAKIDADHLPADDVRTIALRAVKEIKVLLVDGDPGRTPLDSEVFFLKNALRPVPRAEWDDYYVKLTIKTPTELDATRLEDFDAVFAANVTDFSPSATTQLVNYVKGGGAALFFVGDNLNLNYYNNELFAKYHLLPAKLGEARGDAKDETKWLTLSSRDIDHEIVSIWKDAAAGSLSSAKFFRTIKLLPEEKTGTQLVSVRTVVSFNDQTPAMVEKDFGQGRVAIFASTAKTSWNNLGATAGVFVPLMSRTLAYLVARQDEHLNVPVGGVFIHTSPIELVNRDALISKRARGWSDTAKDLAELNESRRIQLENGVPRLTFGEHGEIHFAGPYEVKVAGDSRVVWFAAQSDPEESNLETLTEDQYKKLGEQAQVLRWNSGMNLADTLQQARTGTELTLKIAAAVLLLGAMETLLAHWFSKSK